MAESLPVKTLDFSPVVYNVLNSTQVLYNQTANNYNVFSTLRKTSTNLITYKDTSNQSCTQTGLIAYVTDIPGAINLGDKMTVAGAVYTVKKIEEVPILDKTKGKYLSTGVLNFGNGVGISGGQTGSVKTYNFDISINTFTG
jgi:hypothetical protein